MSTFKLLTLFLLLQVFGFDKWEGSQVVVLGGVLVLLAKYILKYMHLESCKVLLLRLGQLCWTRLLHLPVKDVLRRTRSTGLHRTLVYLMFIINLQFQPKTASQMDVEPCCSI